MTAQVSPPIRSFRWFDRGPIKDGGEIFLTHEEIKAKGWAGWLTFCVDIEKQARKRKLNFRTEHDRAGVRFIFARTP